MNNALPPSSSAEPTTAKHAPVSSISDVFTFKMNRFVMINEREGQRWSKEMFDVSLNEWRILALVKANAPVRAGDVADLMLMDKSQLSRLIKALATKNLIKSKPDTHDARAVVLSLTKKGAALSVDMMAEVMRQNEMVLAPLSVEELAHFTEMLDRLTTHSIALLEKPFDRVKC